MGTVMSPSFIWYSIILRTVANEAQVTSRPNHNDKTMAEVGQTDGCFGIQKAAYL